MATQERIDQLKQYCDDLAQSGKIAVEQRDRWMKLQSSGVYSDGLDDLIASLDAAALEYHRVHQGMQSFLSRVIHGDAE